MWQYQQSTGTMSRDGIPVGMGYSGFGIGKNNPAEESIPDLGPIPQGLYAIEGPPFDSSEHGPYVLRLSPCVEADTYGRSGFLIHGDSLDSPGNASRGCIILPRPIREAIWESGDTALTVAP